MSTSERLYKLLPAFAKIRDAQSGNVLRALLGVVSDELDRVDGNIAALYDNWFIETCDEWVVPYIGDLLGVGPQYVFDLNANSLRPFVADTLGFRRRKGTAAMLEDLAQSVTGWPTCAVEMFQRLATTQHLNHLGRHVLRTPDLRDGDALELCDGPFDRIARFADVRHVDPQAGPQRARIRPPAPNIPHVALFSWRLEAIEVNGALATADAGAGAGRFRFSQLGADLPLFNPSRTVDLEARVEEVHVPGPIRPRPVHDELDEARRAIARGALPRYSWFAAASSKHATVRILLNVVPLGATEPIPPEQIQICDLSGWSVLPPAKTETGPGGTIAARVAVDPVLGRLAFVSGPVPSAVRVSYAFGFSAEIAGGAYTRSNSFSDETGLTSYSVTTTDPALAADPALQDQLLQWVTDGRPSAVFEVTDSGTYAVSDLSIPANRRVVIRAKDRQRPVLRLAATWKISLAGASVELDGFVVTGGSIELATTTPAGDLEPHTFALSHCTLVPGLGLGADADPLTPEATSVTAAVGSTGRLVVELSKCIAGRIDLLAPTGSFAGELRASDSILDGATGVDDTIAVDYLTLDRVTVLGATSAGQIDRASEVIFRDAVRVQRAQIGCVRFSYVQPGSIVPRCYRCQPALALDQDKTTEPALIVARVVPTFTSIRYSDPGYAQLGSAIASEIQSGASDGSEMGAFRNLHQPQREANLRAGLVEYLRFGLEAGIFFVT